jgi:hypothetical protein
MAAELLKHHVDSLGPSIAPDARLMHAKTVVGVTNASLIVDRLVSAELAVGHFQPGEILPVVLRFSNASPAPQGDPAPDMRGLAMRIDLPEGGIHDLLLANTPTSFARNARQFFVVALALMDDRENWLTKLVAEIGIPESRRIATYLRSSLKLCPSLALEHFWSGGPYLWGDNPVRFELRPTASPADMTAIAPMCSDALRTEFATRLALQDLSYRLAVQNYVDAWRTPIEDASVDWKASLSPAVEIATLVIPRQDLSSAEGRLGLSQVRDLAFSPWNAPAPFRPLGGLNRLRRLVYAMSASMRVG